MMHRDEESGEALEEDVGCGVCVCVCVLGWGVDRKFCRNLWVSLLLLHLRLEDNLCGW